jgi:hypothetical protein
MDIQNLFDVPKTQKNPGDTTIKVLYATDRAPTIGDSSHIYDSIFPPVGSRSVALIQKSTPSTDKAAAQNSDSMVGEPDKPQPGDARPSRPPGGYAPEEHITIQDMWEPSSNASSILSTGTANDTELREAVRMLREAPQEFSNLFDKNWKELDRDKNDCLSPYELSKFLDAPNRSLEERAMARFLLAKQGTVENLYDEKENKDEKEWSTKQGISKDDVYVMTRALDKNAEHDPFSDDNWRSALRYAGGLFASGAMMVVKSGDLAGLPLWAKIAVPVGFGIVCGVIGLGAGKLTARVERGSANDYYFNKRRSVNLMLNSAVHSDKLSF